NQGDTLVIEARDKSNYQLIDDQTGFGPQNIIAKREGKDLKIFLEDGDMNPDVVIKGYYGDENSEDVTNLIVGQHENGGIYAYVPESGLKADAVSMLAEEVAAPQALGGEELGSAFWAFNPWWLLGLAALAGGIAAAASGGSGGGGSGNNPSTPRVPGDVNGDGKADENDDDATTENGAPKLTIPEAADGVNAEEAQDGVQAEVTLPAKTAVGDTVVVTVTKPDESTVEATKVVTEDDLKAGKVTVDIPAEAVATDGDYKATAKVTTPEGQSSASTPEVPFVVDQTPPAAPDVVAQDDGSVTVEPKDEEGPTTITYTDENDDPVTIIISKGKDGNWTAKDPLPENVAVDPATGKVTIPADSVKDESPVKAVTEDKAGNKAEDTDTSKVDP
ncbi:BppU family phage baseplate upper protein, partial [Rodentibacter trehalosifermentans]|uniref:BppU family phage baseplate upper protein n=1 Tax=Rodentibacter trehalosifermentans TaxID=1908263 RepID=UPI00211736EA